MAGMRDAGTLAHEVIEELVRRGIV
jgi:hypothetical protein